MKKLLILGAGTLHRQKAVAAFRPQVSKVSSSGLNIFCEIFHNVNININPYEKLSKKSGNLNNLERS